MANRRENRQAKRSNWSEALFRLFITLINLALSVYGFARTFSPEARSTMSLVIAVAALVLTVWVALQLLDQVIP